MALPLVGAMDYQTAPRSAKQRSAKQQRHQRPLKVQRSQVVGQLGVTGDRVQSRAGQDINGGNTHENMRYQNKQKIKCRFL